MRISDTCYRCGKPVPDDGRGHFERHKGGWRVQHAACAIKHRFQRPKLTPNEKTKARAARRRKARAYRRLKSLMISDANRVS